MKGSDIRGSLEDQINYAKTDEVLVRVFPDNNSGTTIPSYDVTRKIGYYFDISFTPSGQYSFKEWTAVFKSTGRDASHLVSFENKKLAETRVKILSRSNDIHIKPLYVSKPAVNFTIPSAGKEGAVRNMTVKISFTKGLDPSYITKDYISVKEGYQSMVQNEIEFVSSDAAGKIESYKLSPSGKLLTIKLKEGSYYNKNATVIITLSKDIHDRDGAPFQDDYTLSFSVGTNIDGLAPVVNKAEISIGNGTVSCISSNPVNETIDEIKKLSMKPFTIITGNLFKMHVEAADIVGYGANQSMTQDEANVKDISCRMVCLYKLVDGDFIKVNPSDSDYYDMIQTVDYAPGGIDPEFDYPDYMNSGSPAPDGLYRLDVFATDKSNNSGNEEKYAQDYGNGCRSFYLIRDASPSEICENKVIAPVVEAVSEKYINKNGAVCLKVQEKGIGISKIKVKVYKGAAEVRNSRNWRLRYNSRCSLADATVLQTVSGKEFTFAPVEANSVLTGKRSGYYFIDGLFDGLDEGGEYKVKVSVFDAAGRESKCDYAIVCDNKKPWFDGGNVSPSGTTGSTVEAYSYTLGNNAENVFPRVNKPGITGADFWDSPVINNGDGVPVRWFYTNADKNGVFGVYLKTDLFDDRKVKSVKYVWDAAAPLSDAELLTRDADYVLANGTDFKLASAGVKVESRNFFSTGTYSFVIIDEAGNCSPAFTFAVVRDSSQPEIVSVNGSNANYLMTLDFSGKYEVLSNDLFQKNRYTFNRVNESDYFFDWWDSKNHQATKMYVRQVHLTGTRSQIRNAGIIFHVKGDADAGKICMFGHRQGSDSPALNAKAERYGDAKPSRTNSGIAQYYIARVYKNWRSESAGVVFEPSFPPETNLSQRFTGGKPIFRADVENNAYKYSRSYAGTYADAYFSKWEPYVAGENIKIPIYKNMGIDSLNYIFCPPITLCLKDNCGNIKSIGLTRPGWFEYSLSVYRFHYE